MDGHSEFSRPNHSIALHNRPSAHADLRLAGCSGQLWPCACSEGPCSGLRGLRTPSISVRERRKGGRMLPEVLLVCWRAAGIEITTEMA